MIEYKGLTSFSDIFPNPEILSTGSDNIRQR
jgi:hypothetical protein